jgi:hypothetical protein
VAGHHFKVDVDNLGVVRDLSLLDLRGRGLDIRPRRLQ